MRAGEDAQTATPEGETPGTAASHGASDRPPTPSIAAELPAAADGASDPAPPAPAVQQTTVAPLTVDPETRSVPSAAVAESQPAAETSGQHGDATSGFLDDQSDADRGER